MTQDANSQGGGLVERLRYRALCAQPGEMFALIFTESAERITDLEARLKEAETESIEREDALRQRALERTVRAETAEARLREVEGALRPFARIAAQYEDDPDGWRIGDDFPGSEVLYGHPRPNLGDFRAMIAAAPSTEALCAEIERLRAEVEASGTRANFLDGVATDALAEHDLVKAALEKAEAEIEKLRSAL